MNTKRTAMNVDIFNTVLTINFSNGRELQIDVDALNPAIQKHAMLHGIKQKLVDAAAIARNPETGASATIDDKYGAVKAIYDRLTGPNPSWNREKAAAGTPASASSLLIRALMQMTGRDKQYVDDFLSSKTKEQRAALQRNPRVLAIIAELKASTVTNGIDTDELLTELSSDEPDEEPATPPALDPVSIAQSVQSVVQAPRKSSRKKTVAV